MSLWNLFKRKEEKIEVLIHPTLSDQEESNSIWLISFWFVITEIWENDIQTPYEKYMGVMKK